MLGPPHVVHALETKNYAWETSASGDETEEKIESHHCGIMEPNPDVLVVVHSAIHQGRHKGRLRLTMKGHKVSRRSLLAGQLYEGENERETETSLVG